MGSRRIGVLTLSLLVLGIVLPGAASAGAVRNVQIMDRCDPASFNALFGAGVCVDRAAGVPVTTFLARVNPKDGGHSAWRFAPGQLSLRPGQSLRLNNRGGETHSFTEVVDFGLGVVPGLDASLPPGTPPAVPVDEDALNFLDAGVTMDLGALPSGTHRFECLIHPWMRATVRQS